MNDIVVLSPESLDIANAYLQYGSAKDTAEQLQIPEHKVIEFLERKDVRDYITGVYLDRGYRNRNKIGDVIDKMIEAKLEEALESGIYSNKDLLEILKFAQQVRMDEMKLEQGNPSTTVQIANFGGGNYGQLMDKLLNKGP